MKKQDWLDQLPPPPAPGTGDGAYRGWKYLVAIHAEKAGVQWDPEKPELPERVTYEGLHMPADHRKIPLFVIPWSAAPFEGWDELYGEMAARYNAVERFLERYTGHGGAPEWLRVYLREERERLS